MDPASDSSYSIELSKSSPFQSLMDDMYERSNQFHVSIKGKKLHYLKPLADKTKFWMYGCLKSFLKERGSGEYLKLALLIDTLEALRNLRLIYYEMEILERSFIVKSIRKIGANPKSTFIATVVTVCLAGYIAIVFGILEDLSAPSARKSLVISGVVAVIVSVFTTLLFQYLENKYQKVKISDEDLIERVFVTRYFRYFGKCEFDQCISLVKNHEFIHKVNSHHPYCIEGLMSLALDAKTFQNLNLNENFRHLKNQESFDKTGIFNRRWTRIIYEGLMNKEKNESTVKEESNSNSDSSEEKQELEIENHLIKQEVNPDYLILSQAASFLYGDSDEECLEYEKKALFGEENNNKLKRSGDGL